MSTIHLPLRLRRLRQSKTLRSMLSETHLHTSDFIHPLFIKEGLSGKKAITSMPDVYQLGLDVLADEIKEVQQLKVPAVLLFGIPEIKDETGSQAIHHNGIIQKATREIKAIAPELTIICDLCFCEYTSHGHCGVLNHDKSLDNDGTLIKLAEQALSLVEAGADMIAPSGMIDGMVSYLRQSLDKHHYQNIPILSYAVKYASSFYGPFREAAEGAPQFGDRHQYQMNIANRNEALREAQLDIDEGADVIMVKPAQNYLDIIYQLKERHPEVPLAAYQVSGEYAQIKLAGQHGLLDEHAAMIESLIALKRAGSDMIISYFAKAINRHLLDAN